MIKVKFSQTFDRIRLTLTNSRGESLILSTGRNGERVSMKVYDSAAARPMFDAVNRKFIAVMSAKGSTYGQRYEKLRDIAAKCVSFEEFAAKLSV